MPRRRRSRNNGAQSAQAFFKYTPGQSVGTFARTGVANQFDINGLLTAVATGVKRDGHYIGGVRTTLIEEARTNIVKNKRDLTAVAWVAVNITPLRDQTGIDGGANTASSIAATAANGTILQTVVDASSARFQTAFVKRLVGTGVVEMTMDGGLTWTAVTVTGAWTRVSIPAQTLANPIMGFRVVTSGDAIAVDWVQNEATARAHATSPIGTLTDNAAAETRNLETYTLPWAIPPRAMTVYFKFIESGTGVGSATKAVFAFGSSANAAFFVFNSGSNEYRLIHRRAADSTSTIVGGVVLGETIELRCTLTAAGVAAINQTRNNGAENLGAAGSAQALATSWSDALLQLNSRGATTDGCIAIAEVKIAFDVQSRATMRAL